MIFKKNSSSIDDLMSHFKACDKHFLQKIEEKYDINKYIKKIYSKAVLYECWHEKFLIGLIAIYEDKNLMSAFITNVSVINSFQKKEIATNLLSNAIEELQKHNYKTINLEVDKNNTKALNLYKKLGFSLDHINPRTDTFFYTKHL